MTPLQATYYDGRTSRAHPVAAAIGGDRMRLQGEGIDLDYALGALAVAPRVANTPRRIGLPDGGACEVADNDGLDRALAGRHAGFAYRLESRPALILAALLLTIGFGWGLIEYGVPWAARVIAFSLPRDVDRELGRGAADTLDEWLFEEPAMTEERFTALNQRFGEVVKAARVDTPVEIRFRSSATLGANAIAFPSGIIVFTDEMVDAAANDDELVGVLAHELGHIHHRHGLRAWLQSSVTALAVALLTGDATSVTAFAAALPAVLVEAKFSREFEAEADDYALDLLTELEVSPQHLADLLLRLEGVGREDGGGEDEGVLGYLSSHPATAERIEQLTYRP